MAVKELVCEPARGDAGPNTSVRETKVLWILVWYHTILALSC